jgi:hypothetical protein
MRSSFLRTGPIHANVDQPSPATSTTLAVVRPREVSEHFARPQPTIATKVGLAACPCASLACVAV